jgi:opacity protein-like surface antigen
MKKFATVLALVACASVVALPAMAQEKKSSISAFGNYSKFSKDKDAQGNVNVAYGYLVSPQLELGITLTETFGAASMTGVGGQAQYYFNAVGKPKQVNPYGKVDAFSLDGSGVTATQYGLYLGAEYEVSESTAVFLEAGSQSKSAKAGGFTSDDNGTIINFGLKLRF